MRLTVLGGSAAGPRAGIGCSGYLVRDDHAAIVVDLGPGTLPELKRHIDLKSIDAIVISHAHLDHTLDLGALRYWLKYNPSPAAQPLTLWIPQTAASMLDHMALAYSPEEEPSDFYSGAFNICIYNPDESLVIGPFTIDFAPCVHYVPTWSLRISSSSSATVLGYTADTGPAAQLDPHLEGVSVLIAEATLLEAGNEPVSTRGHLTAGEAGELADRVGCKTLVLAHLWEELGIAKLHEQAAASFSGTIEIARPGLTVEV